MFTSSGIKVRLELNMQLFIYSFKENNVIKMIWLSIEFMLKTGNIEEDNPSKEISNKLFREKAK
jgi:hypothetical protein